MSTVKNTPGGLGCLPTLCLILIVLKIFGLIAISWLIVFSPLLLQLGCAGAVIVLIALLV